MKAIRSSDVLRSREDLPFAKNSKSLAPGAHSPRARSEGEKHDARARGLERRRHARLALQQTAQSDQDAHPGRGQGAPGACRPERNARPPRSVKSRRAIHHRCPRTTVGPTEERSARAFATSPRGLGSRTRAVPSASATTRDRLPSRRNLQPSAHHLLSSLLSFCPFGHSSANTDERRAYEPPTKRAFDRVGGF